ncbi:MAG: ExbD/TolR family protein [Planctomycetota bacterium]|jgi:biopolymer transport protein ExbD
MSLIFKRGSADIEANLTPMIDVTFLLIVFFVLVSQIVEVESVPMSLPEPVDPLTERLGEEQRAVINVVPSAGGDVFGYRLGTRAHAASPAGLAGLRDQLMRLFAANPRLAVNLRADRETEYRHVQPVMDVISEAARSVPGIQVQPRVNLVVVRTN